MVSLITTLKLCSHVNARRAQHLLTFLPPVPSTKDPDISICSRVKQPLTGLISDPPAAGGRRALSVAAAAQLAYVSCCDYNRKCVIGLPDMLHRHLQTEGNTLDEV